MSANPLKTYRVRFNEAITYEVNVEAGDETQASEIAMETIFAMSETERAWHIVAGGGTGDYDVEEIDDEEAAP